MTEKQVEAKCPLKVTSKTLFNKLFKMYCVHVFRKTFKFKKTVLIKPYKIHSRMSFVKMYICYNSILNYFNSL